MNTKHLLAVTEAAAYLGITKQAVYQLTRQGIGTRVGNMWVFTKAELDTWRAQAPTSGGRTTKRNDRDTAALRGGSPGSAQAVAVSRGARSQTRLPTTVNIDGALHWAGDASRTLCGKHWSPAQMVKPSADICSRCRQEASRRGI